VRIKQFVPSVRLAAQAACEQLGLGAHQRQVKTKPGVWRESRSSVRTSVPMFQGFRSSLARPPR
jgi:hypothetical protein